jgi:glycine cleavage system H protein
MNYPKELLYTKEHEWTRAGDGSTVIGITDYAQNKLGSIVFVELPAPGKSVQKGDILVTVDSVKTVAEVYAPLGGEVEAVNEALKDSPEVINQDCYGQGWMVKLKIRNPAETKALLSAEAYEAFVAEEEAKG